METIIVGGVIVALVAALRYGLQQGEEAALTAQRSKLQEAFSTYSEFQEAFGLRGAFLAKVNPYLDGMPLVVIQSGDFLELLARRNAGPDASDKDIKALKEELGDRYLLKTGMTEAQIAANKRLSEFLRTNRDPFE